jgi:IS30 family transposase
MSYRHLNQEERDCLAVKINQGYSLRQIGKELGRSAGSLSRELRRNYGSLGHYYPHTAQRKANQRHELSHRSTRLKCPALRQAVWPLIEQGWSPELVAGRLKRLRPDLPGISPEAIYQWIYQDRRDLIRFLARAHRKRHPRISRRKNRIRIPGRVPISQRPREVQNRSQAGHWETDLVVGQGREGLQVLVERQSRYCLLRKIPLRSAGASRAALTRLLEAIPPSLRRSITYDNGAENTEHAVLNEDLNLVSYFCEPYHSWEKGTVENTNGLIRRSIPNRTPLGLVPDTEILRVQQWLNDRPRKVLAFQTPREVFNALCVALTT